MMQPSRWFFLLVAGAALTLSACTCQGTLGAVCQSGTDCSPTLTCLEHFGARMSPGGVIVLDDYESMKCPGVPKATIEYLEQTHGFQAWDMRTEQLMLVKR